MLEGVYTYVGRCAIPCALVEGHMLDRRSPDRPTVGHIL
jgi:hypothetical protein